MWRVGSAGSNGDGGRLYDFIAAIQSASVSWALPPHTLLVTLVPKGRQLRSPFGAGVGGC